MKFLNCVKSVFYAIVAFIVEHKIISAVTVAAVAGVTAAVLIVTSVLSAPVQLLLSSASAGGFESKVEISSEPQQEVSQPEPVVSSQETTPQSTPAVESSKPEPPTPAPVVPSGSQYNYNSNMSPDSNVFLDALEYTGYNLAANRSSGLMWASGNNYVLCSRKRGLGWLSNITYGGGCSGYETTDAGIPNIHRFEQGGLVCASYVTYVYFNYLPNIAGIDTSSLMRPERSYDANSWYNAAKQWVNAGYSRYIEFNANDGGSINRDIDFDPFEEIPIGSIMCTQDWYNRNGHCTHISIYAGTVNGYHWVTHVGNENGPEFCAMERMNRKPHPQWPLAIITTPSNIRFSAAVEVSVKDQNGNPISGAAISIKHTSSGTVTDLGTTDSNGKVKKENLSYGEYQITQTVPNGYTCDNSTVTVNFTTANNSLNSATFTNKKIEVKTQEPPATSEATTPQDEDASSNATS